MVRSLLIRQTFVLLDLVLASAVVVAAGLIVFELFKPVQAIENETAALPVDVESVDLPEVQDRVVYQTILASRIFGKAGEWDPRKEAPPPTDIQPPAPEVVETALSLRLLGVVNLGEESPYSSAAIQEDQRGSQPKAFFLGDEVVTGVFLAKFGKREVILLNKRNDPAGKYEMLSMDGDEDSPTTVARAVTPPPMAGASRITVDRNDLIKEMTENYSELMQVQPRLERDSSGRVIGVTTDNISKYSLAQKLGLSDGDILQTINGEKIDSQEKILEAINKYRNGNAFRLGITRQDGSTRVVTYTLR